MLNEILLIIILIIVFGFMYGVPIYFLIKFILRIIRERNEIIESAGKSIGGIIGFFVGLVIFFVNSIKMIPKILKTLFKPTILGALMLIIGIFTGNLFLAGLGFLIIPNAFNNMVKGWIRWFKKLTKEVEKEDKKIN